MGCNRVGSVTNRQEDSLRPRPWPSTVNPVRESRKKLSSSLTICLSVYSPRSLWCLQGVRCSPKRLTVKRVWEREVRRGLSVLRLLPVPRAVLEPLENDGRESGHTISPFSRPERTCLGSKFKTKTVHHQFIETGSVNSRDLKTRG